MDQITEQLGRMIEKMSVLDMVIAGGLVVGLACIFGGMIGVILFGGRP